MANYYNTTGEYYNQNSDTYSNYHYYHNSIPENNIYEPSIYNLFDYNIDQTPHYNYQSNSPTFCPQYSHSITTAYSTFTPSQPKTIQHSIYNPNFHQLTFTTSRLLKSPVEDEEFNAPDFDEYDSTPYGGGYDIILTYGRSLPPSNQTCYPNSDAPKKKVTFADVDVNDKKKNAVIEPEKKKEESEAKPKEKAVRSEKIKEEIEAKPKEEATRVKIGETEWDNNKTEIVSHIPSGYGLEAMDLCESLFGFWPCNSRYYSAYCNGNGYGCGYMGDQGNGAVDYIFGSCDPYVERRDGGGSFGQPIHCYEKRFQEQPFTFQVEFDQQYGQHEYCVLDQQDDSWFRIF